MENIKTADVDVSNALIWFWSRNSFFHLFFSFFCFAMESKNGSLTNESINLNSFCIDFCHFLSCLLANAEAERKNWFWIQRSEFAWKHSKFNIYSFLCLKFKFARIHKLHGSKSDFFYNNSKMNKTPITHTYTGGENHANPVVWGNKIGKQAWALHPNNGNWKKAIHLIRFLFHLVQLRVFHIFFFWLHFDSPLVFAFCFNVHNRWLMAYLHFMWKFYHGMDMKNHATQWMNEWKIDNRCLINWHYAFCWKICQIIKHYSTYAKHIRSDDWTCRTIGMESLSKAEQHTER